MKERTELNKKRKETNKRSEKKERRHDHVRTDKEGPRGAALASVVVVVVVGRRHRARPL
jgi:hypothetical protein